MSLRHRARYHRNWRRGGHDVGILYTHVADLQLLLRRIGKVRTQYQLDVAVSDQPHDSSPGRHRQMTDTATLHERPRVGQWRIDVDRVWERRHERDDPWSVLHRGPCGVSALASRSSTATVRS